MGWSRVAVATNGNKSHPVANPTLAAEVDLDHVPELLGENPERIEQRIGRAGDRSTRYGLAVRTSGLTGSSAWRHPFLRETAEGGPLRQSLS